MNKFLAMLKDSYKEAVDGWIFLVMLVLAGVVILLVGSLSVEPVEAADAVPRMVRGNSPPFVTDDRGQGSKLALFSYQVLVSGVEGAGGDRPWAGPVRFEVGFAGGGAGAAGVEVELDENKKPKVDQKKIKDAVMFGDPFKEAVRYWASRPGEKKPDYTDDLAKEFVAAYVRDATRLNVTRVDKVEAKGKGGGGVLGGLFGGGGPVRFAVTADGGDPLGWTHRPSLFFGALPLRFYERPLGTLLYTVEDTLVNGVGAWVVLLAGVIVTAGFIPNMLRKGAIDLLLTKPLSRPLILLFKYLGGLLFVFLLTAVTVGGVWLMVGLRTGVWATGLLYAVGGITFYFAVLYACSTLVGVLTRNPIVSIVATIVFWFVVWLIGTVHNGLTLVSAIDNQQARGRQVRKADAPPEKAPPPAAKEKDKAKGEKADPPPEPAPAAEAADPDDDREPPIPEWVLTTSKWLNRVTPRTKDLDNLTTERIARDLLPAAELRQASLLFRDLNWAEVGGVAGAWIALFLGLATLRFVTRSY